MGSKTIVPVALVAWLGACGSSSVDSGDHPDGGLRNGDGGPVGDDGCTDGAKAVYVVDMDSNMLSRFDPPTKTFKDLGRLNCPAQADAAPFSMGIDRTATAYVLYDSGELFKVNTDTLACTKSSWQTQSGLFKFGMGFSTDVAGGTVDTLFIAGGNGPSDPSSKRTTPSANTKASKEALLPALQESTRHSYSGDWPATIPAAH